jgi:hypothetical protein
VLTGKAEAGSTVTVTNSTGTVGTALVDDQGNFTITLNPAQNNGETLTARQPTRQAIPAIRPVPLRQTRHRRKRQRSSA